MKIFNLDTPLLDLGGNFYWTARNAVEGSQIFGGIGSGKSSGSGRTIALKFLQAGFGGLVLTVKPDVKEEWEKYCKETGRLDDLIIVEPGKSNFFNFLDYESKGKGMTENIVQVLKTVIRAGEEKASGRTDDAFWENALDMLIFHVIDLCKLAYGSVSVQQMYDIVLSLPPHKGFDNEKETAYEAAFIQARKNVSAQVAIWQQSPEYLSANLADIDFEHALLNAIADARTLKFLDIFFEQTFIDLGERTRSTIFLSFSGFLFRLLRDPIFTLFCNHASTFTPDDCADGKIILLNLPVKIYHKIGRDCQILFKYIWQRAMEKRKVAEGTMPVFLWADEAQNFLHEHDSDFQATARSSRIATVYISQNLPNYHANMGGEKSEYKVKSFMGTLATKIFHANADVETNRYASELIGDVEFEETSESSTTSGTFSSTVTKSLKIDCAVRPEAFVRLKTGSTLNANKVEGYIHVQGNGIAGGQSHLKIQFNQNFNI